jgi:hypothetical protein
LLGINFSSKNKPIFRFAGLWHKPRFDGVRLHDNTEIRGPGKGLLIFEKQLRNER